MADLLHPPANKSGLTIVLKAYLDGSGIASADPAVVVAGYVASTETWAQFETLWKAFLETNGLTRFHAAPYCSRKGRPFNKWSDEQHEKALADITAIFANVNILGCGVGVSVEAFKEWRFEKSSLIDPDPYQLCIDWALRPLIRGVRGLDADEGITIYCDQEDNHEHLGRAAAQWHTNWVRRNAGDSDLGLDPNRQIDIHYGSSVAYPPLQTADILAHATFQLIRNGLAGNGETPRFLDCLNQHPTSVRILYTADLIEAEYAKIEAHDRAIASAGKPS